MSAANRQDTLPEGTQLTHYRVCRELGAGSFGVTYLCGHSVTGKFHVLKEFFPETDAIRRQKCDVCAKSLSQEPSFNKGLEDFIREAEILSRISHPNIIPVTDIFHANGTGYYVMPYIEGRTLHDWINAHKNPKQQALEDIFVPLLEGLKHMHQFDLLHRDIKPDNVYINENGNPVLIDFGAARFAIGKRSMPVTRIITPPFAPHEQYSATGIFTPSLDLYSLAACMYTAVCHELPVDAMTRWNTLDMEKQDPQKKLAKFVTSRKYSKNFLETIDKNMNLHPKDRHQSAFEMQRALLGVDVRSSGKEGKTVQAELDSAIRSMCRDGILTGHKMTLLVSTACDMGIEAGDACVYINRKAEEWNLRFQADADMSVLPEDTSGIVVKGSENRLPGHAVAEKPAPAGFWHKLFVSVVAKTIMVVMTWILSVVFGIGVDNDENRS